MHLLSVGVVFGRIVRFGLLGMLLEPGNMFVKVGTSKLVVEMEGHVRELFQGIKETLVKACSVDCLNVLQRVSDL